MRLRLLVTAMSCWNSMRVILFLFLIVRKDRIKNRARGVPNS